MALSVGIRIGLALLSVLGGASGCEFRVQKGSRGASMSGWLMIDSPISREALALLANRCATCHAETASASAASLAAMGWLVPGDSAASPLYQRVSLSQMPPRARLASAETELLRSWIDTQFVAGGDPGAPGPTPTTAPRTGPQVLLSRCASCHAAGSTDGGSLTGIEDPARLIRDGWITPGDAAGSALFQRVASGVMPPSSPLPQAEVQILRAWIDSELRPALPLSPTYASLQANVLTPKCVRCHGSVVAKDGIRLDSYAATRRWIASGQPLESKLYRVIQEGDMPPRGEPDVSSTELQALSSWITSGAADN